LKFTLTETGKTLRVLTGHSAQVNQIKFSHSGHLIATSGKDNTIRIWNLNQINQRPIVITESAEIERITFAPDDSQVMYALTTFRGNDAKVENFDMKILPLNMRIMAQQLCEVLQRNLTKDEWEFYVGTDLDYESTCKAFPPNNK
jgi:WD40 repeat protein